MSYINKIKLGNNTYNIGNTINIENTELTTSTTDVPSTNLMKTLIDEINNKIQENTNNIDELTPRVSAIESFLTEQMKSMLTTIYNG